MNAVVPPKPPPSSGLVQVAGTTGLIAGLVYMATFVYFSLRARFTVPYMDDWSLLASLQQAPLAALLQPHNEHIMLVPRLLVWTDFWIWGWPGYATYLAAIGAHAVVVGIFVWLSQAHTRAESRLLTGMVLTTTCTTYAIQGAVFPSAVNFSLVFGFGALAIASLSHSIATPHPVRWAIVALVSSVVAMLSVTSGFAVPLVLAGLSVCLRLPRRTTAMFVCLVVVAVVARQAIIGMPDSAFAASPMAIARFTLATLAGPVASLSPSLAVLVGAVFAVPCIGAMVRFVRAPVKQPLDAFIAGTVAFIVLTSAMTAVGRAHFDPSVAAESRYTELVSLGWASVLYYLISPGSTARPVGRLVAVLLPVVSLLLLPAQVFVGRVWAAKADHLRVAALTLTTDIPDTDWTWRLYVAGRPAIDPALPLLKSRGVWFLEFPERGRRVSEAGPAVCDGRVNAFDAAGTTEGLRIQGQLEDAGSTLHIVDRDSRVRGLALPAPAVMEPRAPANDFVWAEVDILAGRLDRHGRWLGLTARGAGPPYTAQLLDDHGQVVCTVPVVCCDPPPRHASRGELVIRGSMAEGYVDSADCTAVSGWVWDPVRPDTPVDVRVRADNGVELVEPAALVRQDLVEAGKGKGAHAFRVSMASLRLPPGSSTIRVSQAATGVELTGSPRTVTCGK